MTERIATTTLAKWAGIALVLIAGAIHAIEGPENYVEARGIGVLFFVSAVAAVVAAWGMFDDRAWGWSLGAAMSAACLLGYVLSRTVGIPGKHEASVEAFLEPLGVLSLVVELLFVVLAARVLTGDRPVVAARS